MTRFLHESCEHCRHARNILLSPCPNPICAKALRIDVLDVFDGLVASHICPLCKAPLVYRYSSTEGFAVDLDIDELRARADYQDKRPWADLIPRKPL